MVEVFERGDMIVEKRILGKDLSVSAVGFGCMGFSHAYGAATPENEAIRMLQKAYEIGYTFFDTAEVYGTADDPHVNEIVVGKALKPIRNHVQIASKFGIRFDMTSNRVNKPLIPDSRPEVIRASIEGTLKRLQTDYIDLYFQHRIDPSVEPEIVAEVMSELIREGKILHWGISEATEEYLRRAHAVCPVTAIENRYSMMARHHAALFPVLEELGIGFVAFSPMANGFLSGKYGKDAVFDQKLDYRSNMPQFTVDAIEENQKLLQMLYLMADERGTTPAALCLAWMMCEKPYIVPIPGTRKTERMMGNASATEVKLDFSEIEKLNKALDKMPMSAVFGGTTMIKK